MKEIKYKKKLTKEDVELLSPKLTAYLDSRNIAVIKGSIFNLSIYFIKKDSNEFQQLEDKHKTPSQFNIKVKGILNNTYATNISSDQTLLAGFIKEILKNEETRHLAIAFSNILSLNPKKILDEQVNTRLIGPISQSFQFNNKAFLEFICQNRYLSNNNHRFISDFQVLNTNEDKVAFLSAILKCRKNKPINKSIAEYLYSNELKNKAAAEHLFPDLEESSNKELNEENTFISTKQEVKFLLNRANISSSLYHPITTDGGDQFSRLLQAIISNISTNARNGKLEGVGHNPSCRINNEGAIIITEDNINGEVLKKEIFETIKTITSYINKNRTPFSSIHSAFGHNLSEYVASKIQENRIKKAVQVVPQKSSNRIKL